MMLSHSDGFLEWFLSGNAGRATGRARVARMLKNLKLKSTTLGFLIYSFY